MAELALLSVGVIGGVMALALLCYVPFLDQDGGGDGCGGDDGAPKPSGGGGRVIAGVVCTSQFEGVGWNKKGRHWRFRVRHNNGETVEDRDNNGERFATDEDAARARDAYVRATCFPSCEKDRYI